MKHLNVTVYDTYIWNWYKSVLCDVVIFITSCTNEIVKDKIWWFILEAIRAYYQPYYYNFNLGALSSLMACSSRATNLGIMLSTKDLDNKHKKIYSMNNTMVFDH